MLLLFCCTPCLALTSPAKIFFTRPLQYKDLFTRPLLYKDIFTRALVQPKNPVYTRFCLHGTCFQNWNENAGLVQLLPGKQRIFSSLVVKLQRRHKFLRHKKSPKLLFAKCWGENFQWSISKANTRAAICTCYFLSIAAFASTFFPATNNTCSWGNPCKMPMIPTSRDKRGSLDGACLNSCLDTAPVHPNCQLSFSSSALHITSYCQHTQIKFPWSMDGFCQICRTHQLDRDLLKCMS